MKGFIRRVLAVEATPTNTDSEGRVNRRKATEHAEQLVVKMETEEQAGFY